MTELIAKILGHWLIQKFLGRLIAQIPEPLRPVLAVVTVCALTVVVLSLAWSSWRVRQVIRKSLGRDPRLGEDTSLNSWMRASSQSLDTANRELERVSSSRSFIP